MRRWNIGRSVAYFVGFLAWACEEIRRASKPLDGAYDYSRRR